MHEYWIRWNCLKIRSMNKIRPTSIMQLNLFYFGKNAIHFMVFVFNCISILPNQMIFISPFSLVRTNSSICTSKEINNLLACHHSNAINKSNNMKWMYYLWQMIYKLNCTFLCFLIAKCKSQLAIIVEKMNNSITLALTSFRYGINGFSFIIVIESLN